MPTVTETPTAPPLREVKVIHFDEDSFSAANPIRRKESVSKDSIVHVDSFSAANTMTPVKRKESLSKDSIVHVDSFSATNPMTPNTHVDSLSAPSKRPESSKKLSKKSSKRRDSISSLDTYTDKADSFSVANPIVTS
jgi:hypothetical protein